MDGTTETRKRIQPAPRRWRPTYTSDRTNLAAYYLRYLLAEPRDFTYCIPRRIACHTLGRHNATCDGNPRCPYFRARRSRRIARTQPRGWNDRPT